MYIVSFVVIGKSSLLSVLGTREVPIPAHVDIFHLKREMPPSDKTALECVMEVDQTRLYLEAEAEELAVLTENEGDPLYILYVSIYVMCVLFLYKHQSWAPQAQVLKHSQGLHSKFLVLA